MSFLEDSTLIMALGTIVIALALMSFLEDPTLIMARGTIVIALATIVLVFVTAYYAVITNYILIETRKAREINYIERKLENFYLPLQNALILYENYYDDGRHGERYVIAKATSLNEKLNEVENYNYLASPELINLIRLFQNRFYFFNHESPNHETGDMYNKMGDLLEKIEKRLKKDLKECLEKIHKLTF